MSGPSCICCSAASICQTREQKCFMISVQVAADWHEIMIPQHTMQSSIAHDQQTVGQTVQPADIPPQSASQIRQQSAKEVRRFCRPDYVRAYLKCTMSANGDIYERYLIKFCDRVAQRTWCSEKVVRFRCCGLVTYVKLGVHTLCTVATL